MRIGIFAPGITVPSDWENNVSGHVQVPMGTARALSAAGHDVHVIGTRLRPDDILPACQANTGTLHLVPDGRQLQHAEGRRSLRSDRLHLARQFARVARLVRGLDLDVVHFFGFERTLRLAELVGLIGRGTPVVATLLGPIGNGHLKPIGRWPGATITATEHVRRSCPESLGPVTLLRHGILRSLANELSSPIEPEPLRRILFWREADVPSGGDLAREAFLDLAPKYPDYSFDFALRSCPQEIADFEKPLGQHSNIQVHRFPYGGGHSLASLIAESLCVVLPYRSLSIHPQFAIAESMAAGAAVISTSIESTPELLESGNNGLLVEPNNSHVLKVAIEALISEPSIAIAMGKRAAEITSIWNWDEYTADLQQVYAKVRRTKTRVRYPRADSTGMD